MHTWRVTFKDGSFLLIESSSLFGVYENIRSANVNNPRRYRMTADDIATVVKCEDGALVTKETNGS